MITLLLAVLTALQNYPVQLPLCVPFSTISFLFSASILLVGNRKEIQPVENLHSACKIAVSVYPQGFSFEN